LATVEQPVARAGKIFSQRHAEAVGAVKNSEKEKAEE